MGALRRFLLAGAALAALAGAASAQTTIQFGVYCEHPRCAASDLSNGTTGTGAVVLGSSPSLTAPNLGTPSFANLIHATGLPSGSITGLGAGVLAFLRVPSSANLAAALIDKTGTGLVVFEPPPVSKTADYTIPASASRTTFDNTGAVAEVDLTLPVWAANLQFGFVVVVAQPVKIIAPGASIIAIGPLVTDPGGSIQCALPYSAIILKTTNQPNVWVAIGMPTGPWG